MENGQESTPETQEHIIRNTLIKINEHLTADEKKSIAINVGVSITTLYNYLKGAISNKYTAAAIIENCTIVLKNRNVII